MFKNLEGVVLISFGNIYVYFKKICSLSKKWFVFIKETFGRWCIKNTSYLLTQSIIICTCVLAVHNKNIYRDYDEKMKVSESVDYPWKWCCHMRVYCVILQNTKQASKQSTLYRFPFLEGVTFSHQDEESNVTCLRFVPAFHTTQEKGTTANYFKIYCFLILAAMTFSFSINRLMISSTERDHDDLAELAFLFWS